MTDHEVQTRTASFSSETSEENVVSSRVKMNIHVEDNQQDIKCPQEEHTASENEQKKQKTVKETHIIKEENDAEDSLNRSKTVNMSDVEDSSESVVLKKEIPISVRALEVPLLKEQVINKSLSSKPQNKYTFINSEVDEVVNTEPVSSLSVTDSEGDNRVKTAQETSGKSRVIDSVKTEILEPPLPTIRVPDVEGTIHYVDASQETSNDKVGFQLLNLD